MYIGKVFNYIKTLLIECFYYLTFNIKKKYYFQTIAMSYLAAFVSAFYEIEIILMALGMTTLITLGISLIATFTKVLSTKFYIWNNKEVKII